MKKTDYHCHILPGIDDGAQTPEEGAELAASLLRWGFTSAVCTPHIVTKFRNNPQTIHAAHDVLRRELEKRNIELETVCSAEYRLVPETWPEILEKKWIMPFDGNHILIELPITAPQRMKGIQPVTEIRRLRDMGYTPVLAHPERYAYLKDEELLELNNEGALFQIDYTSLAGVYDIASETKAKELIARGLDSKFYGTDLHNRIYADFLDRYFHICQPFFNKDL